ncbi:MAG: galactose-1-phosphate uridylyltransferase [Candidatus Omnitrophica bacterium]|jgi:UDPglucose--hexose-1-phosphate uridylyltransferase|nr:galactose-1-phosphate uridylyltransferase [Candidatus Omnitrophota bacterium]
MPQLRRDPIVGRWVIVETDKPHKPEDYAHEQYIQKPGNCPFCYGNENQTPAEIEAFRYPDSQPNSSGWQVRVIPNKFPALQIEGDLDRRGNGIYDLSNGIGAHEVLIETPYHAKDLCDLSQEEIERIIAMYCHRINDLTHDHRFKYIMLFRNYGPAAGASLEHPHTQLVALPMVPKNVMEELSGAKAYYDYRERCVFCDVIRQELEDKQRIILENKHFACFCPFVSRFPFEIWITPKHHKGHFCQMTQEELPEFCAILKDTITKIKKIFPNLSYNFIVHSSPINGDSEVESYHWHLEFMPKLTRVAGFEWGTGFYYVATSPETAAQYLKSV